MAGMKWKNRSPSDPAIELIRPLLDLSKSELCDYAEEKRIHFREDQTNQYLDFRRNRIRNELLPLLRRSYQPALHKTVLRTMEIIRADTDFVNQTAMDWLERLRLPQRKSPKAGPTSGRRFSALNCDLSTEFDGLPIAVQRRCIQVQLLELGIEPNPLPESHRL